MLDLPNLGLIIISALIDSINPSAIGVLILIVSVVLGGGRNTKRLISLGLAYILAIFVTYLAIGIILTYFFIAIPSVVSEYIAIAFGVLVTVAGIIHIKDYFWYGKGFTLQIPKKYAEKIHKHSSEKNTIGGVIALGAFVALIEVLWTGAPYIATVTILRSDFDLTQFLLLAIYNLVFISPLIVILVMVARGAKISDVSKWKEESKSNARLLTGLLLTGLGWILILVANGVIDLG